MRIFVDTSAFYAILDKSDSNHKKAKMIWSKILNPDNTLITNNYVLVESFALIQHRLGMEAVKGFQEDVLPVINIEFISSETHKSGVSALLVSARRKLSLVDCISFETIRTLGIKNVFSFDTHFNEQGYNPVS